MEKKRGLRESTTAQGCIHYRRGLGSKLPQRVHQEPVPGIIEAGSDGHDSGCDEWGIRPRDGSGHSPTPALI